jgi:hypothetical protein
LVEKEKALFKYKNKIAEANKTVLIEKIVPFLRETIEERLKKENMVFKNQMAYLFYPRIY